MLILFPAHTFHLMLSCCVLCRDEGGGHHSSAPLERMCCSEIGGILALKFRIYFLIPVSFRSTALAFLPLLCHISRLK